jgi:hypothetical protein
MLHVMFSPGRCRLYLKGASLLLALVSGCKPAVESGPDQEPASSEDRQPSGTRVQFVDVAMEAGITVQNISGKRDKNYIIEAKGGGIGFFDYDGDFDLDAYVINGSSFEGFPPGQRPTNRLYRNEGNGTFSDVTQQAGVGDTAWSMGCAAADYDNDGDADLYITNYGANRLYRNEGNGTFSDVTQQAGVGDPRWGTGAAFGDYDLDGDLDLYVANFVQFYPDQKPTEGFDIWKDINVYPGPRAYKGYADVLYRNEGNGTFTDVTQQAGALGKKAYNGFQCLFGDVDQDGYPDLFVANDSTPNLLYHNKGDGTFEDISLASGSSHSEDGLEQAGMGTAFGDYDNDGDLDLFLTHFSGDYNTLYQNEGGRFFRDVSYESGVGEVSMPFVGWGTGFFDFDNDGDLDLFVANGHVYPVIDNYDVGTTYAQRNLLFENLGNGHFEEISVQAGSGFAVEKVSRGAAFGDYDEDGDIDILVLNVDDTPTLLRNDGGNRRHWLHVSTIGKHSNRDGIGARIEVFTGERVQLREVAVGTSFLSQSDLRVHFGLGDAEKVDRLKIRWPSSRVQEFTDLQVDQWLVLSEERGIIQQ